MVSLGWRVKWINVHQTGAGPEFIAVALSDDETIGSPEHDLTPIGIQAYIRTYSCI